MQVSCLRIIQHNDNITLATVVQHEFRLMAYLLHSVHAKCWLLTISQATDSIWC